VRILALDPGERRIGVAMSDPSGAFAFPHGVIDQGKGAIAAICELATESAVGLILVGMPLTLRGEQGPAAQGVAKFVDRLREQAPVPVETWDERLSTATADRVLTEAEVPSHDRRGKRDQIAATVILEHYLQAHRRTEEGQ
jgi:putative holliday junction resolvase